MEEQQPPVATANLFADILPSNDAVLSWEKEWVGMPEYKNQNLQNEFSITVNFRSEKDMYDFSKITGQKITYRTKFIWYPEPLPPENYTDKSYIDES